MATQFANGKTTTSGLVFMYDTTDKENCYKGEPTTNQYANSDFVNGTTGWTFGSWDSGRYTYSVENILGPFGKIVLALKITRTSSDTSYAHFHQGNGGKYSSGNTYTLSAYVKGSGTLYKNTQGGFSGNTGAVTLTGAWQRVDYTVLSSTDSNYPYWAAENITQNVPMYFVFGQSEQKPHVTPYVAGTRSATEGLRPLVNNSSLDLTNVSFDANAQMTFDGTNDYFDIPYSSTLDTPNGCTYELIVYPSSNGEIVSRGSSDAVDNPRLYVETTGNIYWDWSNGTDRYIYSTSNLTMNAWNHLVCTATAGSTLNVYINGQAAGSGQTMPNPLPNTSDVIRVGSSTWVGRYINAKIPSLKIYNRALTQAEVTQNYNAIKTRFNLA